MSKFYLCSHEINQGFTMTFLNGVTVSVRWGSGNYSDGKTTAEVAAMNSNGDFIPVTGYESYWREDEVIGRMNTDFVVDWMFAASRMEDQ